MSIPEGHRITRFEETKRLARVLQIVQLVGAQPRVWTRRRLAQRYELSERMIAKDLDVIRHGLRLDLRHARDGYYFGRGPLLKPVELTVAEALALALAAQQARDTGSVDAAVIGGALGRLEEALPRGIVPYLRRTADGLTAPFGPMRERGPVLMLLERAQTEGRKVEIEYATASRDGAHSRRTIAPYYLHPYERSWLVIAADSRRDEVRMFKVDRIEWGELTEERYTVPEDFDPVTYLGDAWGVLRGTGPAEDVVLRFSAQAGRWVCDERWHPSQRMEWLPDGSLTLRFHCGVTNELVRWVLSFGSEADVLGPKRLRDEVTMEVQAILRRESAQ